MGAVGSDRHYILGEGHNIFTDFKASQAASARPSCTDTLELQEKKIV
jgi:hypothetical protein